MKIRIRIPLSGMTALAAVALGFGPARAAIVATPVDNDIFLGIHATGGTGSSVSYLVNLGQYSQFASQASGTTVSLSGLGDIGTDLVATFGANWNTRADVKWGIFGRDNSGTVSLFSSREEQNVGTPGPAWAAISLTRRQNTSSSVGTVLLGINGYNGRESTPNSTVAVLQDNGSSSTASYNYQVVTGASDFGTTSGWSNIEGDFGGGTSGTALDLFKISASGVTTPGFFTIANSGGLSFTTIPEPSAGLLGAAGVVLLLTNRRRRLASI